MKIFVVSGFLGAGKTTFIKELIRRCAIKPVVLENEYGQTDVDAQTLSADSADVWGLKEGCVCCTKSEDMMNSVVAIENVIGPEYLIIEPSGIAKLGSVLSNLKKLEYERIILLKPVLVLDAINFFHDIKEFKDICEDQIRSAGTVVLSKLNAFSQSAADAIAKAVRELNPGADILTAPYEQQPEAWWKHLLAETFSGRLVETENTPPPGLETLALTSCSVSSPAELLCILNDGLRGKFGFIVRAKGIIFSQNQWVMFDISGGIAKITGCGEPTRPECVWIGFHLDRPLLEEAFHVDTVSGKRLKKSAVIKESPEKSRIQAFKSIS